MVFFGRRRPWQVLSASKARLVVNPPHKPTVLESGGHALVALKTPSLGRGNDSVAPTPTHDTSKWKYRVFFVTYRPRDRRFRFRRQIGWAHASRKFSVFISKKFDGFITRDCRARHVTLLYPIQRLRRTAALCLVLARRSNLILRTKSDFSIFRFNGPRFSWFARQNL